MSVRFVAIVDAQNQPAYFKSAPSIPDEVSLNHQFIAEMSLDFLDRQGQRAQSQMNQVELLLIHDGVTVYGMVDNTLTKYIIGVLSLRETPQLDQLMGTLSQAFVEYQINPFRRAGLISSPAFDRKVSSMFVQ